MARAVQADVAAGVLEQVGRVPGASGPFERITVVVATLVLAAAAFTVALLLPDKEDEKYAKAVAALAAGIAFIYGYLQWRAARHESSYDHYYDRLDVANRRFDASRAEDLKDDRAGKVDHLHTMFVFAELDNLEYVLGKYRLRYVRPDLACRAMRAFAARCRDDRFRGKALDLIGGGGSGYEATTQVAVRTLAGG